MMQKLVLGHVGYAAPSEHGGVGPFFTVFDKARNLNQEDSLVGVDAIVVWGGEDISPTFYDETRYHNSGPTIPTTRDLTEWHLISEAHSRGIPMIGVCRGAQMMCAYAGGKLVQHCNGHGYGRHAIETSDKQRFSVSSIHHQMMYPYDVSHELLAWSVDRLSKDYLPEDAAYCQKLYKGEHKEPELVLFTDINALAVQCHPEYHASTDPFNIWFNRLIMKRFFL